MIVPVEILVALCLLVGVLPALTIAPFLNAASLAVLGAAKPDYHIALWHGFNLPLLMSVIALAGGLAVYSQRRLLFRFYESFSHPDMKLLFEAVVQRVVRGCIALTRHLENGSLQRYMAFFVMSGVLVGTAAVWPLVGLTGSQVTTPLDAVSLLLGVILLVGAFGTVLLHHNRFAALLLLSVVGLMVALIFVRFSAPDLALTQLSVEVVTIVLIMLALYFLPQLTPNESNLPRVSRDVLLAGSAGAGMGLFTWAILTRPYTPISEFFLANSLTGGGGTNVVNVILVDFRGFDTLGEITVLLVAAVGIYSLLLGLRLPVPRTDSDNRPWAKEPHPPILSVMGRILLPLALMVSAYIFVRGHNLPGGGFIAGLITSVAIILQYVSSGVGWIQQRLSWEYRRVAAAGVLLATISGLGSWAFGHPFLTSTFAHVHWPLVGEFELASAMVFDAGVYLTVVGATLLILAQLGILAQTSYDAPVEEGH